MVGKYCDISRWVTREDFSEELKVRQRPEWGEGPEE